MKTVFPQITPTRSTSGSCDLNELTFSVDVLVGDLQVDFHHVGLLPGAAEHTGEISGLQDGQERKNECHMTRVCHWAPLLFSVRYLAEVNLVKVPLLTQSTDTNVTVFTVQEQSLINIFWCAFQLLPVSEGNKTHSEITDERLRAASVSASGRRSPLASEAYPVTPRPPHARSHSHTERSFSSSCSRSCVFGLCSFPPTPRLTPGRGTGTCCPDFPSLAQHQTNKHIRKGRRESTQSQCPSTNTGVGHLLTNWYERMQRCRPK